LAERHVCLKSCAARVFEKAQNSGQIVIFCNRAPVGWLTAGMLRSLKRILYKIFFEIPCPKLGYLLANQGASDV